ncbi:protein of unknown function, YrpD [Fontibacillus panacisegetis]|uniref:Uncharacterized protein n=1 Tax=Fontibacillus panacisegetis TaxID=670482 RepID=A0A1G7RCD6_9BACL|nr:YrpD family protein [Fontibacillus panacisegetis]SDG08451.1 protein of unknown function, YrpD [Fontibacillus panacisegetis]
MREKFKLFNLSILLCSLFFSPLSALAEVSNESDIQGVNVFHLEEKTKESPEKISQIITQAKEVVEEQKTEQRKYNLLRSISTTDDTYASKLNYTYNYITFDDDFIYFYEESVSGTPELLIYDNKNLFTTDNQPKFPLARAQTDFISDGVGGKITITKTGSAGSYLSTSMTLPTLSQVSTNLSTYTPYNYGGFEYTSTNANSIGSWVADMGLQLYNNLGPYSDQYGWKPVVILKQLTAISTWTQYATAIDSVYKEGQYKNGYKVGTSPVMYFWYNYNGKVRMKVDGTTICPTRTGEKLEDTHNITIIESSASWNISTISRWKILSTVVSSDNTGKNRAVFSSIKVDGIAVDSSNYGNAQTDQASVTKSGNNVTIIVDSDTY